LITEADNALIQPGDDFGFDGNSFWINLWKNLIS
jgi:hypothetical protein